MAIYQPTVPDFNLIMDQIKLCLSPLIEGENCPFVAIKCGLPVAGYSNSPTLFLYRNGYEAEGFVAGEWILHYRLSIAYVRSGEKNRIEFDERMMNYLIKCVLDEVRKCTQKIKGLSKSRFQFEDRRRTVPLSEIDGKKWMFEDIDVSVSGKICKTQNAIPHKKPVFEGNGGQNG